jgi:hypothetical protein
MCVCTLQQFQEGVTPVRPEGDGARVGPPVPIHRGCIDPLPGVGLRGDVALLLSLELSLEDWVPGQRIRNVSLSQLPNPKMLNSCNFSAHSALRGLKPACCCKKVLHL